MAEPTRVLVDTNILLEDPDVLVRINNKNGLPFLTSTVLDELDYNKDYKKRAKFLTTQDEINNASENAKKAQLIFRELTSNKSQQVELIPPGEKIIDGDILTIYSFRGKPVYLVGRESFRTASNNDAKIIELAKDYSMVLITKDKGMKLRAESLGVKSSLWTNPNSQPVSNSANRERNPFPKKPLTSLTRSNNPKQFRVFSSPTTEPDLPIMIGSVPSENDKVKISDGSFITIGSLISSGGEGVIYTTSVPGMVCKIYHKDKLTSHKKQKINLMVSRKISRKGVCWPTDSLTNIQGEFVGYLMPRAHGYPLQKSVFVKPLLEKTFSNWTRLDLVRLAIVFLHHVQFLHGMNIIIGDINPLNILVSENSDDLWIVDTDSFQIENYPCPVGTINFTPPELHGKSYSTFLRKKDNELFAVATMLFMILLPGKPPYSQQGGGSPQENIRSGNFPYTLPTKNLDVSNQSNQSAKPRGTWQYIWGNLPYIIKKCFVSVFQENKMTTVGYWIKILQQYEQSILEGKECSEIFPITFSRQYNLVEVHCAICQKLIQVSKNLADKHGESMVWCPDCRRKEDLKKLSSLSVREMRNYTSQKTNSISQNKIIRTNTQQQSYRSSSQSINKPANIQQNKRNTGTQKAVNQKNKGNGLLRNILRLIFK